MITSKFYYYVWKMHNLQIVETPKKAKSNLGLELNFLLMQKC